MGKLQVEYVAKEDLKTYANNAKIHTDEQIEQIKKSITEFGFNDPIAVWKDNEIIEGHGRLIAVMEMDEITEVPIIRLDDLSDEQRRAYMLVHNKLTMNTDFDIDVLNLELETIEIDMGDFGFDDVDEMLEDEAFDISKYTKKVNVPQYEPQGEMPETEDLVNEEKTKILIEEIEAADIDDDIKHFLKVAAYRHNVFNYKNIAEFYCHQPKEVQELMEKSALVIIDFEDAIANGYVRLEKKILEQIDGEYDE